MRGLKRLLVPRGRSLAIGKFAIGKSVEAGLLQKAVKSVGESVVGWKVRKCGRMGMQVKVELDLEK